MSRGLTIMQITLHLCSYIANIVVSGTQTAKAVK